MQFHLLNHGWMIFDYKGIVLQMFLFILSAVRRERNFFRQTSWERRLRLFFFEGLRPYGTKYY